MIKFKHISRISNPPKKPTLIWDGECDFCEYWIQVWQSKTGNKLQYEKYQDVYERFPSIPLEEFKKASRLIETNGDVFSGPDSAYRSFMYFHSPTKSLHLWYYKYSFFRVLSNNLYNWIAKHRAFMFKLTKLLWS